MSISTESRRCIKPLIIFNSIFATGLLEYYNDTSIKIIGYVYAVFSIVLYFTMFYIILYMYYSYMRNRSLMLQVTFQAHTYSHLFFLTYTIVCGIFRGKHMKCLLTQMEHCMRIMEELNMPRNYPKYHRHQWYLILSALTIIFIMGVIDFIWSFSLSQNYDEFIFVFVAEHYPFVVLAAVEVSFVYWISSIRFKFCELNAVLRDMLTTTIDSPQHKRVLRMRHTRKDDSPSRDIYQAYQMNEDIKKIKKMKQMHLELIKYARITNTTYGWHVLMSMTTSFILLTTLFYNVYNLFFETLIRDKLDFIGFIYWIFYFTLKIVVTTHVCSMTIAEMLLISFRTCEFRLGCDSRFFNLYYFPLHAEKTGDIICELYEPSKSKEYRAEIRDFTQQLIQNPLTFTACGFFNLDHTYIRSVIGSVTTYLVILIQVGSTPLKFYIGNETLSV